MKKQFLFSLLALSAATGAKADGNEARLLRFPATNGTDIVFSYAGDLYTAPIAGGEARRLTSHVGYEIFPRFSPDGKTIAFTGEYDGNREVYIIPADGGEPRRLTYTATNARDDVGDRMGPNNIVMTWTPNGEGVVYRNRISDGFDGRLWTAPLSDGMPQALPLPCAAPRRHRPGLRPPCRGIPAPCRVCCDRCPSLPTRCRPCGTA